jgi:hypothetical protein
MKNHLYIGDKFMIAFCDARKTFFLLALKRIGPEEAEWVEELEISASTANELANFFQDKSRLF